MIRFWEFVVTGAPPLLSLVDYEAVGVSTLRGLILSLSSGRAPTSEADGKSPPGPPAAGNRVLGPKAPSGRTRLFGFRHRAGRVCRPSNLYPHRPPRARASRC